MQRVYLDSCALQRPLDALATPEEEAEAACVSLLLQWIARRRIVLVWSSALEEECIALMPQPHYARRRWAIGLRRLAGVQLQASDSTFERAARYQKLGRLGAMDALHLACSVEAKATLVSVDRKFVRRGRRLRTGIEILSPIEFVSSLWEHHT